MSEQCRIRARPERISGFYPIQTKAPVVGGARRAGGTIRIVARRGCKIGRTENPAVSEREGLGALVTEVADLRRESGRSPPAWCR